MNEKEIAGLLIGVVYPAMILAVTWVILIIQDRAEKYNHPSKRIEHRIRK